MAIVEKADVPFLKMSLRKEKIVVFVFIILIKLELKYYSNETIEKLEFFRLHVV